MKPKYSLTSLFIFIIVCLTVEVLSSYWTNQSLLTWYPKLIKPLWTPPGWIFGPVWTVFYIIIAISGWLIYNADHSYQRKIALIFYWGQLSLNFVWSFLFFSLKSPISGLIDILFLCLMITFTIIKAWPVRRLASILLVPYLIWVIYATSLNAAIWLSNR